MPRLPFANMFAAPDENLLLASENMITSKKDDQGGKVKVSSYSASVHTKHCAIQSNAMQCNVAASEQVLCNL